MRKTRDFVSLIADISDSSGLIKSILYYLFIAVIKPFWRFATSSIHNFIILIIPSILLIYLLFLSLKRDIYRIKTELTKDKIKQDIREIEEKTINAPLEDILPVNKVLARWLLSLNEKVKEWDPDAKETSTSFYLEIAEDKIKPIMQVQYTSVAKELKRTMYEGHLKSISDQEASKHELQDELVVPFFVVYADEWREVVLKAYKSIVDILPDNYELIIHSHKNHRVLSFSFNYKTKKVNRSIDFEYDGIELKNLNRNSIIPI